MVRGRTAPDEDTRVGEVLGAALLPTIEIVPQFFEHTTRLRRDWLGMAFALAAPVTALAQDLPRFDVQVHCQRAGWLGWTNVAKRLWNLHGCGAGRL